MKSLSTLALVAAVGLLQTGCFNSTAENNQPQEAQAASITATAPVQSAAPAAAPVAAPATAPVQSAAPAVAPAVAAAPAPVSNAPTPVAPAPVSPAPVAAAPAAPQVNAYTYFVSTNDGTALNVRSTNSTQSQVIGSLPQGTQVQMHGSDRSGEWFEVSAAGVRGWVAAAYLIDPNGYRAASSVPAQVTPAPAPQASHGRHYDLYVSTRDGDALNLRANATTQSAVIQAIPNRTGLTYLDTVGRWTQVMTPGGAVGYVASDYVVSH